MSYNRAQLITNKRASLKLGEKLMYPIVLLDHTDLKIGDPCLSYKGVSKVKTCYFKDFCVIYVLEDGSTTPNPKKIAFFLEECDFKRVPKGRDFWISSNTSYIDSFTEIYLKNPTL